MTSSADATVKAASDHSDLCCDSHFRGSRELEANQMSTRARIRKADAHRISYCNLRHGQFGWEPSWGLRFSSGCQSVGSAVCLTDGGISHPTYNSAFAGSTSRRTNGANAVLLPDWLWLAPLSLLIPSGHFSMGFVQRVRHPIQFVVQQLRM